MGANPASASRSGPPRLTLVPGGLSTRGKPVVRILTRANAGAPREGRAFFFVVDVLAGMSVLATAGGAATLLLPLLSLVGR